MARADLLVNLVKYGISGDNTRFRRIVESIIVEERAKQHKVLAEKLEFSLGSATSESPISNDTSISDHKIGRLLQEIVPQKQFQDLILPDAVNEICNEVVEEHHRSDLLRSYNLEPRSRILLIGPPGNGKTSLAEALAEALIVPLILVRYEGVIGTYLGETAVRLRRLIEHVSTRQCVLFFDEFETLGKERGDTHETGEIKRVVSSLLMQIDSLPSHVVVIGATNHPELLDRAVWRRFQVRMNLPEPTKARLAKWFRHFEQRIDIPLGYTPETMAEKLYGHNFAEIEEFGTTLFRQYVLGQPGSDMKLTVRRLLKLWKSMSEKTKQQNGEKPNG